MNPKPLRLTILLTSTALLIAALSAATATAGTTAAAGTAAAAKKCPKGKLAWKLEGKPVCVSGKLPAAGSAAGPAVAELGLREASRPAPGGKLRLSPALRRALPRAGALLAKELGKVGRAGARASNAGRGPLVERYEGVLGREELGNGVVAEGRVRARVFEDGSHEAEAEFEISDRKGNSILYTPDYGSLFAPDDEVGCPTAAGLVRAELRGMIGGTVTQRRGNRVIASKTASQSWKIRGRGQVGTDARLRSVSADVTLTAKSFERGLQQEMTAAGTTTLDREGAPRASGTPTANVTVRAAGATRAEEREYELAAARALVTDPALRTALAETTTHARKRLLEAEPRWYSLPNECAQLAWTPAPGATLEPTESRSVTAVVVARRDGGVASGRVELTGVDRGRLLPIAPAFAAAGPASFLATAAEPNAGGVSVQANAIATSTAGRAQATWFARATPVELPQRFVGTIASRAETAGLIRSFHGNATYTRTALTRGPDGTLHAWYELSAASLGGAKEILGPESGCRFEANGTSGQIESGDLELRVLPGGEVHYALLYDLKVPSVFSPTDCPPGPEAFDGEIAVFLNSRRPGPAETQLRAAAEGYWLTETQVGDVTAEAGVTTTASWSLVPG